MSRGSGTIQRDSFKPAGGGGGGVTGAQNGLTLNGANVELGGNPLLQFTGINLDGFLFELFDITTGLDFSLDPSIPQINLNAKQGFGLLVDGLNDLASLGDVGGLGGSTQLVLNDGLKTVIMQSGVAADLMFNFDAVNGVYQMGDVNGAVNGTNIVINDTANTIGLGTNKGSSILLDGGNAISQIGDTGSFGNTTIFLIDDTNQTAQLFSNANIFLNFDMGALSFRMGDIAGVGNGLELNMDDTLRLITMGTNAGFMFTLDQGAGIYMIGDVSGVAGFGKLILNDAIDQFDIELDGTTCIRLSSTAGVQSFQMGNGNTGIIIDNSVTNSAIISINTNAIMNLNNGAGVYQFGDISASASGSVLVLSDVSQFLSFQVGGFQHLRVDAGNNLYQLGDIDSGANGGKIELQDAANLLILGNNANNLAININGVGGFTGTVTPVTTITVNNGIVTNVA